VLGELAAMRAGFPAVVYGQRIAQAACDGERSVHDRQRSAEKQILGAEDSTYAPNGVGGTSSTMPT
jgi:hypothetical protein